MSNPLLFRTIRVVTLVVRSDHKTIVAFPEYTKPHNASRLFNLLSAEIPDTTSTFSANSVHLSGMAFFQS